LNVISSFSATFFINRFCFVTFFSNKK